jgi:2-dehydro-3-deoxygalactonokinase
MIAIDWGTTHLRAYRLTASGEIEARKTATKGIMAVAPGGFAAVLEEILADWPDLSDEPILMSGMIGRARLAGSTLRRMSGPAAGSRGRGETRSSR